MEDIFCNIFGISVSFKNVVEILILYVIFLLLLKFIQATPGISVFRGVLIVSFVAFILMFFVARGVKLSQLNFILEEWFFPWFIIGLIIIFQPELRQAFNKIGQTSLFSQKTKLDVKNLNEILYAVKWLSTNKLGALIVVENNTKLNPLKEKGIKLEADINGELIKLLFHKSSPLHDGAIVIANRKIEYARCFLPLMEVNSDFQRLGSRHRAGISITSETDAVSIIVSEETGRISVASKGSIVSVEGDGDLGKILTNLLVGGNKKQQ